MALANARNRSCPATIASHTRCFTSFFVNIIGLLLHSMKIPFTKRYLCITLELYCTMKSKRELIGNHQLSFIRFNYNLYGYIQI